jgi:hypothetical protein
MELVDMIRLSWIAFLHIGSSPIFDIEGSNNTSFKSRIYI